jgi:transposase
MEVRAHEPLETLEAKVNLKRYAPIRDRIRAVILARRGHSASGIGKVLGRYDRWVQKWVYRYRDQGFVGLEDKPRPGARPKLAWDQQAAFRRRLEGGPRPEDKACRLAGREIRRILHREFGADYTLNGTYRLLHRLGYACLKPRPRHRKSDPAAQEAFKQAFPLLSGM